MTEQQIKELIAGFGFVDFDNSETIEPPPTNYKPVEEHEFSEGSREVFRIVQERKKIKVELTKDDSYRFLDSMINNNSIKQNEK